MEQELTMKISSISDREKTVAVICHLSALLTLIIPFAHILAPLVIWLLERHKSPFIDAHGKKSLKIQVIITALCFITIIIAVAFAVFVGFIFGSSSFSLATIFSSSLALFLVVIFGIIDLILIIKNAIKASKGVIL